MFEFKVIGKLAGRGRTGVFTTPHGDVHTPVFMPVGTAATVKAISIPEVENMGSEIVLANNYHLYLRPGSKNIAKLGGIHKFMRWDKPVLTDSGGFQVFSLGNTKVSDDGVQFSSHLDGTKHFFSPEVAMQSQIDIGADIIMAMDICTPDKANKKDALLALTRTHDWLTRCKQYWLNSHPTLPQALFGIIQGALHKDLRRQAAEFVASQDLPGIAIGGETIGFNMDGTEEVMDWIYDLLPNDRPHYTMGLGLRPTDLIRAILAGADMFDCVAPTRIARNGALYTGKVEFFDGTPKFVSESPSERIDIGSSKYKLDQNPVDPDCDCSTCQKYDRAYLHHLHKCHELLFYPLASIHNLRMMIKTVEDVVKLSQS